MYCEKDSSSNVRKRSKLMVWCIVLAVMGAIAVGDVEQGPAEADWDQSQMGGIEASDEDIFMDKTIQSITFKKNIGIRDALRFLAAKYQKNIVPSASVDGVVTVTSLYDVTFEEALEAILGYGYKYDQEDNFIRVYTAEEYKKFKEDKSRMTHKVFRLYYITATEAEKLVTPVLSSSAIIQASSAAKEGISLAKEGVVSGSAVGGDSMALHDSLMIYDYPENLAKAEEVIAALDVRPKQILIEATILSAHLTEGIQLGIDWNTVDGVAVEKPTTTGVQTDGFGAFVEGVTGLTVGITNDHLRVLIRALETVTDITILANPKILALNKQVGTVFIGTRLGYRDRTTIDASGQATVGEVKFLDTGTKLSFRPYIADDGYIRMDIYPKDSSGELDELGIPTETTAELVTNIMVKDGQTIVIGGLFRDSVTTTRSQVPVVGDIPLVGAAFRGTDDSVVRQEIIVMLTPHIISDPEETDGEARAADIMRKRYGARTTLQGISRAKLAEDHYANAVDHYADGNSVAAMYEVDEALAFRPTYLEALRLKERIISEVSPDEVGQIERIMLEVIEQEEAPRWHRY
ncbi:MAG: hypothetical protein JSV99_11525 [Planctomycetota bacterium]|nr:MAG: hypothetical protein JSV99_11525 [Planctomycetota bacterium]